MRIIIVASGSWGDVRPTVVLGQALQHAGYDVVLVAAEAFRTWVEGRGVAFAGLSVNVQAMLDAQTDSNLVQTLRWMRTVTQATVRMGQEIAAVIRAGDAVLVSEGLLALLNGALERHHVRLVHINLQPWVPTIAFSGLLPALPAWMPFGKATYNRWAGQAVRRSQWWALGRSGNRLRSGHLGLPKQTWAKHRAMLDATPSLLLVSPQVLPRPVDWPPQHRITGYIFDDDSAWEAPRDLQAFLAGGTTPVYIGFGSMRDHTPQATTQLVLDAVQRTGHRAIVLSGWAGLGRRTLPAEVFSLTYAPHSWLFPRVAAVVHHGGAGTTAAGLRAGVPAVIVPVLGDQPFWGRRVHELGAGTRPIARSRLTVDALAAAITDATTNNGMHTQAADLGAKIRAEDGVSQAVSAIQSMLEQTERPTFTGVAGTAELASRDGGR